MSQLKAFVVREPHEGICAVIFDTQSVAARRRGAAELWCEFEDVASCVRAPDFDRYAPGPVPMHATLAAGWQHICSGCSLEFSAKKQAHADSTPVEDSDNAQFCSQACMMKNWQNERTQQAYENAAVELAIAVWPQALKVMPWVDRSTDGYSVKVIALVLPGMKSVINWDLSKEAVGVSPVDLQLYQSIHFDCFQPQHVLP